jgi:hypothetical protein
VCWLNCVDSEHAAPTKLQKTVESKRAGYRKSIDELPAECGTVQTEVGRPREQARTSQNATGRSWVSATAPSADSRKHMPSLGQRFARPRSMLGGQTIPSKMVSLIVEFWPNPAVALSARLLLL